MNRLDIIKRARVLTRDLKNTIFREEDVIDFINEAIDRVAILIPQCESIEWLVASTDVPNYLPSPYHHQLALYCASRLYTQDDNDAKAVMLMNEFEAKMDELKNKIDAGEIIIKAIDGTPVATSYSSEYVVNNYFTGNNYITDEIDTPSELPTVGEEVIYDAGEF